MSASTDVDVRMFLRIGRHRHLDVGQPLDAAHEIGAVLIATRMRRVSLADAADRVAAQRHDVAHAGRVIAADHVVDLVARRADAGEMRGRRQFGFGEDTLHRRVGALARRAAGAIGDRDEVRPQRREALDRFPERILHLVRLRWEELERDADADAAVAAGAHEISDHHATSCARRRENQPRIAREPERDRDLAVGAGLGRERPVQRDVQARRRHPLRHSLGREAETQVRVVLAQEFKVMRREVDDQ